MLVKHGGGCIRASLVLLTQRQHSLLYRRSRFCSDRGVRLSVCLSVCLSHPAEH